MDKEIDFFKFGFLVKSGVRGSEMPTITRSWNCLYKGRTGGKLPERSMRRNTETVAADGGSGDFPALLGRMGRETREFAAGIAGSGEAEVVHRTRVHAKRMRAFLRAVGRGDPGLFGQWHERVRLAARRLGSAREAAVLPELMMEAVREAPAGWREGFRGWADGWRCEAEAPEEERREVAAEFERWAEVWGDWRGGDWSLFEGGLRRVVKKQEKLRRRAFADDSMECWHRWRRWLKYHGYLCEMAGIEGRAHRRIRALAKKVGEAHDAHGLGVRVVERFPAGPPRAFLERWSERRMRDLLAAARSLAEGKC